MLNVSGYAHAYKHTVAEDNEVEGIQHHALGYQPYEKAFPSSPTG